MKYGETLEFEVDRLDRKGRGCGILHDEARFGPEGRTVCAENTVPGERVRGSFIGKKKGVFRVGDAEILEPSPERAEAPCPHASVCGGCATQHIRYETQTAIKLESLNRTLGYRKLGLSAGEIVPAEDTLRYRNRMDYVFGPNGALGLKRAGRWDRYVDLDTCMLMSEEADRVRLAARDWARDSELMPWDNRRHEGYLRYFVIRESRNLNERMAMLITSEGELTGEVREDLVARLSPLCTAILHGINPTITDLSVAEEITALTGEPLFREEVAGIRFSVHPNGFFQTNTRMAGVLAGHVRSLVLAGAHERVLDLYCGVGLFSLTLAGDAKEVLGIELDEEAIAMARRNAEENGVMNARFRAEAAETLSWSVERPDVVIVDPPRSGLHPKVTRTLLEHLPPRIIYVSCGPVALARDLEMLMAAYEVDDITAFDLFPQTPHVETVVHLRSK